MKQDYTLYIYKADKRCKAGERLFSTTVWTGTEIQIPHDTPRSCDPSSELYWTM